ncbi:MAG TPA: iron-sulfur cluster repair di-iron protein [Microthrixaceae bacterium]|nr:iron-sulfur cluster repair di-iron protein [Microthrixaceae bacterium]
MEMMIELTDSTGPIHSTGPINSTGRDTLAEIVNAWPAAARVLDGLGLDYCCGGRERLDDACAAAGLDPKDVLAALGAVRAAPDPEWRSMGPAELVDHLEATHHAYLHDELPRLDALLDKVVRVHGARHRELGELREAFGELAEDLEPHLLKEERVLFPMIRELESATELPSFHCGSIANPVSRMMVEHDRAGELLARIRLVTYDHTPPADACGSYRALFTGLADLEADTHLHVHKENNVLFPAVIAMEQRLAGPPS